MKVIKISVLLALLCLGAGCILVSSKARSYEGDGFSFTIPAGWATFDEVWDRPMETGYDSYGLGVGTLTMIQTPRGQGKGRAFFFVAGAELAAGETLLMRFEQGYTNPVPEIRDAVQETVDFNGTTAYAMTYERPWGEPWWKFRDLWLEQDGMVYVLSFHCSPGVFDEYAEVLDALTGSFVLGE